MNKPIAKGKKLPLSPNLRTEEPDVKYVIRARFSRKGATAFVAHLDMMRIFERSLKRAGVDCEYSQGFNPRPVMAFALPLGVGVETIDDYVDISLNTKIQPAEFVKRMKNVFPAGLEIIGATIAPPSKESMMAQVSAAQYLFLAPGIAKLRDTIIKSETLPVEKMSKGTRKTVDVRPLILSVEAPDENSLKIIVKAGSKENLRPDLFLESLSNASFITDKEAKNTEIIRTGTFINAEEGVLVRPV